MKKILIINANYYKNISHGLVESAKKKILNKYKIKPDEIKQSVLFEKKIFNQSKGLLKLLDVGDLKSAINIEVSYASKNAIAKVEKNGGKVNLIKV